MSLERQAHAAAIWKQVSSNQQPERTKRPSCWVNVRMSFPASTTMVEPSPEKAVVWALVLLVDVVRFLLEAVLFLLEVLPPEEVELFLLEEFPPEEVELFLLEELPPEEVELFLLEELPPEEVELFLLEELPPEEVELFLLEELPPEEVELFLLEELPPEEELFRLELLWLFVWEELEFFFEELLFVLLPQEARDRASAPAMQTARPRVK